jgi:hypothetical protein
MPYLMPPSNRSLHPCPTKSYDNGPLEPPMGPSLTITSLCYSTREILQVGCNRAKFSHTLESLTYRK